MKMIVNGLEISMHSICEAITNSSTVVYTWPVSNSIRMARGIFDRLIKALGLSGSVEDYFDIKLSVSRDILDYLPQEVEDCISVYFPNRYYDKGNPYDEFMRFLDESSDDRKYEIVDSIAGDRYRSLTSLNLTISPKNDNGLDLVRSFSNLFNVEAEYN